MATVLWFRHGLRLHDNPALLDAISDRSLRFYPIFIFDGESAGTKVCGYNRMSYLLRALADLDGQLRARGGRLHLVQGRPDTILTHLVRHAGVVKVCWEQDCEPVWAARDRSVRQALAACTTSGASGAGNTDSSCSTSDTGSSDGASAMSDSSATSDTSDSGTSAPGGTGGKVRIGEHVSHTLWNPATVIHANGGIPPLTYEMFLHTVGTIGVPPRPVPDPDWDGVQFGLLPDSFYEHFHVFDKVPQPEELGVPAAEGEEAGRGRVLRWQGGETTALQQLQRRLALERETFMQGGYLPTHGSPDLLCPPYSLSPALRFGCLSVRKFYWAVQDLYNEVHQGRLPAAPFITGQLIWREYFYTMSVNNPCYGQMRNNDICIQIPWREPTGDLLERWKTGRTGFPFVDAGMVQLVREGWAHHTVRNTLAAFLSRGTLWLSWEHGLQHFLYHLLDADWSVCAGNWMWVSSSAFEALLDAGECACPVTLGRRLDPSGEYVRRYVPALRNMPTNYIYEPWRAPLEVQEQAGCIIGKDYPERMVDHERATHRNRLAMEVQEQAGCIIGKDYPERMVDHERAAHHNRLAMERLRESLCRGEGGAGDGEEGARAGGGGAAGAVGPSSKEEVRRFMWLSEDPADAAPNTR